MGDSILDDPRYRKAFPKVGRDAPSEGQANRPGAEQPDRRQPPLTEGVLLVLTVLLVVAACMLLLLALASFYREVGVSRWLLAYQIGSCLGAALFCAVVSEALGYLREIADAVHRKPSR